jgi:hypothetical protein
LTSRPPVFTRRCRRLALPFTGAHVPKRQFEELVIRAAQDFEAFYADPRNALAPTQMATAERQAVDACATISKYAPYLDYDKALADGLPIATGVIEGICRHLVEDRMNFTGARWSLTGAEAVLRLRALRASEDFDAYWQFHEQQEHERNHASHYANHRVLEVPPSAVFLSQPNRRSTLQIVNKKGESPGISPQRGCPSLHRNKQI